MASAYFKDEECASIEVQDLITLSNLNEQMMMETIRLRYAGNLIYTWTGTILVSVNPFVLLPIYTPEIVQKYLKDSHSQPPHIFAVADRCFKDMISQARNQCVLISGESGAGKTEATKLILQFLAAITQKHSQIEQQILEVNPILEAFGNAKTIRNNNSSRFGRFTEIQFSQKLDVIVGATVTEYLLEKSRISFQAPNERSYHVFYQMLAGASQEEIKELDLLEPKEYRYLNQSGCVSVEGINDEEDFEALRLAMDSLMITTEQQKGIFSVLSAVLHLGNVEFQGKDEVSVSSKSTKTIATVARLLGFDNNKLVQALTVRSITVRNQTTVVPLKMAEAIDGRDALAKALYSNLFSWLVQSINKTLSAPKGAARLQIGILDIFGFEHFKVNSFEQLMINFTNEKLQQQFNNFIFKLEQAEYEKEKINWSSIQFVDNQDVLDLIEKRPLGVLSILDEECKFPKATDVTFLDKLHANHVKNPRYVKPKMAKAEFGIEHFAGQVMYTVNTFLDKNRDTLGDAVRDMLQASKVPLVVQIFQDFLNSSAPGDPDKAKVVRPTVGSHFKQQLNNLMTTLSACSPHYVRCIKPNFDKLPLTFDIPLVTAQLRYAGMLETIRIRRLGFPQRFPLKDFHSRFKCLLEGTHRTENLKSDIANVFIHVLKEDNTQWQIGTTKVFLKDHHKGELESRRNARLGKSCIVIQKSWRMYSVKRRFLKMKKGAVVLQAVFRMHRLKSRFVKKKKSAVLVQSVWRMFRQRKKYVRARNAIISIQSAIKTVNLTKKFKALQKASEVLQTNMRMIVARLKLLRSKRLVKALGAALLGFLARAQYSRLLEVKWALDEEAKQKRREEELARREAQRLAIEERQRKAIEDRNAAIEAARAAGKVYQEPVQTFSLTPSSGAMVVAGAEGSKGFNDERTDAEYKFLLKLMEAVDEFNEAARFMIRSRIDFIVNEDKEMAGKVRIVGKGGAPDTRKHAYITADGTRVVEKIIYIRTNAEGEEEIEDVTTESTAQTASEGLAELYARPVVELATILANLTMAHLARWWPKDINSIYNGDEPSEESAKKGGSFLKIIRSKKDKKKSPGSRKTKKGDVDGENEFEYPQYPLFFTLHNILVDPLRRIPQKSESMANLGDHPLAWEKFVANNFKDGSTEEASQYSPKLTEPLLATPADLVPVAMQIFTAIMSYMNGESNDVKASFEENRSLQFILKKGIESPIIRNEIYCQIVRQLNNNPNEEATRRGWEVLYFITGAFPPEGDLAKHVRFWLTNQLSPKPEPTQPGVTTSAPDFPEYTQLCTDNLKRLFGKNMERESRESCPSIIEIATLREKLGSLGIYIKVCGGADTHLALDANTTASDVLVQVVKRLVGRDSATVNLKKLSTYYALYETINNTSKRVISPSTRIMDVLRRWEVEGVKLGSIGMAAAFGFLIRKRICLFDLLDRPSVVETDLEFQQVTTDVLEGLIHMNEKDAIRLAALRYSLHPLIAKNLAQLYIPKNMQQNHSSKVWLETVSSKAKVMHFKANTYEEMDEIKRAYLKYARRLPTFATESFQIQNKGKLALPAEMEITINGSGIHLLEPVSKAELHAFKWGEFENWRYDAENKVFSFVVKTSPPWPVFSFDTQQGDAIISLMNDYDAALREESVYAIATADHKGDDRQLSFSKDDLIIIKFRNSEKWYTGKLHSKHGLCPAEKLRVVLKGELPIKNPQTNYKYLKELLQTELSLFKITDPDPPHVDEMKFNMRVFSDLYFRKAAQRDVRLVFTKDAISTSLIDLPFLEKDAPSTFALIMKFMGDMPTGAEPEAIATELFSKGQSLPEIRDEVFCQLCKQLSGNPKRSSILRGLELMGLCAVAMPPTPQLIPHLMSFLQASIANYEERDFKNIAQCIKIMLYKESIQANPNLDVTNDVSRRQANVKIQLSYGPSVEILFDAETTVKEMFKTVVHRIHLKNTGNYYLYLTDGDTETRLQDTDKLSDLIEKSAGKTPGFRIRRITMTYKQAEGVVKLDMLFYQAIHHVISGMHPLTPDEAAQLAGLHLHCMYGDYEPAHQVVTAKNLADFVAPHLRNLPGMVEKINKAHSKAFGQTVAEAKSKYVETVSRWHLAGASLFLVEQGRKTTKQMLLAITEDLVLVLTPPNMEVAERFAYSDILNWSVFPGAIRLNTGSAMKPVVHIFNTPQGEHISDMLNFWRVPPSSLTKSDSNNKIRGHSSSSSRSDHKPSDGSSLSVNRRTAHRKSDKYENTKVSSSLSSVSSQSRERSHSITSEDNKKSIRKSKTPEQVATGFIEGVKDREREGSSSASSSTNNSPRLSVIGKRERSSSHSSSAPPSPALKN